MNSSITFSEQGSRLDNKSMFKRKTKEDITERVPVLYRNERLPSENESPGKGISSDRYKLVKIRPIEIKLIFYIGFRGFLDRDRNG